MTTSVQRRRGTTVQHSTFTGLEGELTIDTSKDTAVIHDGATVGGFPLAKEGLENTNTANLTPIVGSATAADDTFLIYDTSAAVMKKITRAELNNAIEVDALANVTITGGSINGTTIGATTASSGKFTTLTNAALTSGRVTYAGTDGVLQDDADLTFNGTTLTSGGYSTGGNLTFTGTGNRITGDFSNTTVANRAAFQTSTVNDATRIGLIPNGTSVTSQIAAYSNSDPTNASVGIFGNNNATVNIQSAITGTGTYLPLAMFTSGSERLRIDTSGNVGIGTASPTRKLDVYSAANNVIACRSGDTAYFSAAGSGRTPLTDSFDFIQDATLGYIYQRANLPIVFGTNNTERMRITSSGAVGIGTTAPQGALHVAGGYFGIQHNAGATYPAYNTYFGAIGSNFSNGGSELDIWNTVGSGFVFRKQTGASAQTELMRIDSSGNVGIGTSSPSAKLDVTVAGANLVQQLVGTSGVYSRIGTTTSSFYTVHNGTTDTYLYTQEASALRFGTNATERMRIDSSGNVGIGTSSPNMPLTVVSSSNSIAQSLWGRASDNLSAIQFNNNTGNAGSNVSYIQGLASASGYLSFGTLNTERIRIDASGNMGIGINIPSEKLDVNGIIKSSRSVGVGAYDGVYRYANNGYVYTYSDGSYLASYTSNTERMRIDANGNVGIGTSSPASKLHVVNTANASTGIRIENTNAGSNTSTNTFYTNGTKTSEFGVLGTGYGGYGVLTANAAYIYAASTPIQFAADNSYIAFGTGSGNPERMRIDSSGNLLVGTTSDFGGLLNVSQTANLKIAAFRSTSTAQTNPLLEILATRNTTNNTYYAIQTGIDGVGYRFQVADSGNVTNSNNSYGAISDVKLKENIVDATSKLEDLCSVKVRNFNFIGSTDKQIGVIAQEIEQIFPSIVDESSDKDMDGNDLGTTTKSVKYSVFVPMLIKAIQEQQAMIEELKAKVAALEAA